MTLTPVGQPVVGRLECPHRPEWLTDRAVPDYDLIALLINHEPLEDGLVQLAPDLRSGSRVRRSQVPEQGHRSLDVVLD
jgi:hypothetical protein